MRRAAAAPSCRLFTMRCTRTCGVSVIAVAALFDMANLSRANDAGGIMAGRLTCFGECILGVLSGIEGKPKDCSYTGGSGICLNRGRGSRGERQGKKTKCNDKCMQSNPKG